MFKVLKKKKTSPDAGEARSLEELARLAGIRAENYFNAHRLSCSEANLLVLNHGFGSQLSTETAIALGSGFGGGVGGSGCVCGALSGVIMGLGLYLGPGCKGGLTKRKFRALIAAQHDVFKKESGSVCCRELICDIRKDRKKRATFCSGLTGGCAERAVRVLLEHRPELAETANLEFLQGNDSSLQVMVGRIMSGWS